MRKMTCAGDGTIYANEVEDLVFDGMCKKLEEFKVLKVKSDNYVNPKINQYQIEVQRIEIEIDNLLDKLSAANDVLMNYINNRIKVHDNEKNQLEFSHLAAADQ